MNLSPPLSRLVDGLHRLLRRLPDAIKTKNGRVAGIALVVILASLLAAGIRTGHTETIVVPPEFLADARLTAPSARYRLVASTAPDGGKRRRDAYAIEILTVSDRDTLPGPDSCAVLLFRDWLVPAKTGGMKLLSNLAPGEYALPLDGRYVTAPDYPAISFRYARLKSLAGKRVPSDLEAWFKASVTEPKENELVFISAVGDLMPGRGAERLLARSDGLRFVFGDTLPILRSSDLTIGNLEGAVTAGNAKATKTYTFKYGPKILGYLKDAGFDYLMTTNNHSFDYGAEGFADTLKALREAGIATSGAGENLAQARRFWRTTIKGQAVSVISCGAYPVERTGFDGSRTAAAGDAKAGILWESPGIPELVRAEKETGAFVIACVHGGEEYRTVPSERQRAFYRKLADSGCDVVFGSHPHVLQPLEERSGRLIVYSLGNFLFPGMEGMPGAEESEIVRIGVLKGRIVYREVYPARLSGTRVALGDSVIY
jgi:poly-gamma-glutamate synthesis protein (capsule biosynthesis protein)